MQNIDAKKITDEARTWVGTPYEHQHWKKGAALDCVGLIIGVGLETGALTLTKEQWAPFANYSRTPNPSKMRQAMELFLVPMDFPLDQAAPDGMIGWFQWRDNLPMHLAIMASLPNGRRTMIHAYQHVGKCVEHGFSGDWRHRVESWWKYPGMKWPN